MKTPRILVGTLLFLAGSIAGRCPVAAADPAAKESWNDAVQRVVWPREEKVGDERFGYTCVRQHPPQWPSFQGWWRVLKEGTTPHWWDANGDGKRDPAEVRVVRYCLYYTTGGIYVVLPSLGERLDSDGFFPSARKYLDRFTNGRPVSGIGQAALYVPPGSGDPCHQCKVVSGPLFFMTSVGLRMDTARGSGSWLLSTEPSHIKATTEEFPERESLLAMIRAAQAEAELETCRLAAEVDAAWQRWCGQKIAGGSGLKGIFEFTPGWYPSPNELSAGLVPEGGSSSPRFVRKESLPQEQNGTKWTAAIEERYEIRIPRVGRHDREIDPIDAPIELARPDYDRETRNALKNFTEAAMGGDSFKGAQALSLPGADEAARFTKTATNIGGVGQSAYVAAMDTVVFRIANVVVVVTGSFRGQGAALPPPGTDVLRQTRTLAELVLRKIRTAGASADSADGATLALHANPAQLWADATARSILRLAARTADGRPLAAAFSLEATGGGTVSPSRVTTDANGAAEATYTASARPGEATITASGRNAVAFTKIREGGLVLRQKDPLQPGVLADGRSAMAMVATFLDPSGQPASGIDVRFTVDEGALPSGGRLEPATAKTDGAGCAEVVYTAPPIDAASGFRLGDVFVSATATSGTPAGAAVRDTARFAIYAGEVAFVEVVKPGYTTARFPVPLAGRNATVRGVLTAIGPGRVSHRVASASVRLLDAAGQASGVALTEEDGTFAARFIGDPTSGREVNVNLPEPLVAALDPDLANRLTEAREALKHLAATGHDVTAAAGWLHRFPELLARSRPGHADPSQSTEYAVNVMPRLAWMCLYTRLADDRQTESIDWFMDSLEPVIKQLADLLGGIDRLEKAAKEKLGEQFDAAVWRRMKETVVGRFLRQVNVWHRRNTRPLRKAFQVADTAKEIADHEGNGDGGEGFAGNVHASLQLATEPVSFAADQLQEQAGTDDLGRKLQQHLKSAMTALLRANMETPLRERRQALLRNCAEQVMQGRISTADHRADAARAKELFTTFEREHNALNLANLDRELYRLDVNLFMNTVVKGVFLYNSVASLASKEGIAGIRNLEKASLESFQKSVTDASSTVGAAADTLDSAFGAYKGVAWLDDLNKSAALLEQLGGVLLPSPAPP